MIKHFKDIKKEDIAQVGGKGVNLGILFNEGYNVPNGFVVTTKAYYEFVEIKELKDKIMSQLRNVDINDHKKLEKVSKEIKALIHDEEMMEHMIKAVEKALEGFKSGKFAVRSSATAEDLINASFAGQQDTFLNVGKKDIISCVKKCWASLFNPRAIFYREEKKIPHDAGMAVVIQEMVDADFAGVMFTLDPIHKKHILVEAATGLGEKVVSGEVTPSSFFLDRESFKITQKFGDYPIDEEIVKEIAKLGLKIEKHYKRPQDIEFAVKNKEVFILQSRAITT